VVVLDTVPPRSKDATRAATMPSLFRFLAVVGILAGLVYGGIIALAVLVHPQTREISVTIPQDRFYRQR
jgi:hypothetical protein